MYHPNVYLRKISKISNKEQTGCPTGSLDIFMTGFINVEIDLRVSVVFCQIRKLRRVCRRFLIIAILSCCWRVPQSSFKEMNAKS